MHLLTATRREIEDIFLGLGFRVMEGPETELVYYNFDALNFDETHPSRQATDTFYVSDDVLLRVHTSPMQTRAMEMHPPPLYVVIPGRTYRRDNDATHTPQFNQVEGLAVDEDVTLGDLQGTLLAFAQAIFGEERRVRLRPHFFPFTEPSVECDVSCFNCQDGFLRDGSRCPLCKGEGWIEILGAGEVDPNVFEYVREHGYDPDKPPGLRLRHGHRADRHAQARRQRPAAVLRQRPALPGAVRMRVPLFWLHDYCDPGISVTELEHLLTMSGTKVEAIHPHGVGALEHFLVGRVLSAERHPDADRLTVCTVDVGTGDERTIVCGAPNVAAGQIVAVAEPGAVMPDGTKLRRAKLRGVESAGMILAEDEVAIGPDHDGIMVLDPELRPGTPLIEVLPIAGEVLELEITPNRPDCLSIYGVAREAHAATGAPLAPPPWTSDPGTPGEVPGVSIEVQDPELCPRFTARLYEGVTIGPSPEWLKARLTAAGHAADQQRRRHHELRDAGHRAADARVRLRPRGRRPAGGPARARRRDDDHARRRRARPSTPTW